MLIIMIKSFSTSVLFLFQVYFSIRKTNFKSLPSVFVKIIENYSDVLFEQWWFKKSLKEEQKQLTEVFCEKKCS